MKKKSIFLGIAFGIILALMMLYVIDWVRSCRYETEGSKIPISLCCYDRMMQYQW